MHLLLVEKRKYNNYLQMCADRFGICSTKIQSGNMPAYISGKEGI